jgi:hypothetical protein
MASITSSKLLNLPDNIKEIFVNISKSIRQYGDGLILAEFSLLTNQMILIEKWDSEKLKYYAENGRKIIELVIRKKSYLEEQIQHLKASKDEYIQSYYSQGLIFLCSSLEQCIKELISRIIEFDDKVLGMDAFNNIHITISDYFQLSKEDRYAFLAEHIIDNLKCGNKGKYDRYERCLEIFEMKEGRNNKYEKELISLFAYRNCIVHNSSIVDRDFVKLCPWEKKKIGEKLVIDRKYYSKKEKVISGYISEIFYRLNIRMGAPEEYLSMLRKNLDSIKFI